MEKTNNDIYFLKNLGQNVKRLRENQGLTQEQLSIDVEMEISQISRIERGIINTSIGNLKKIAKALNVDVKELF